MKKRKLVFFPFLKYYTPVMIEHWFAEEAKAGWFPKINILNFIYIVFKKNMPKGYQYFLDFQFRNSSNYISALSKLHCEYVGRFSNVGVWRWIDQENDDLNCSQTEKSVILKRFRILYWSMFIPMFYIFAINVALLIIRQGQLNWPETIYYLLSIIIAGVFTFYLGRAIICSKHNKKK